MQKTGALAGLNVADFTWAAVGPVMVNYLGDHGATVVRVESYSYPDICRMISPFKGRRSLETSGFFTHHNTSKYSVSWNLRSPKGRELALRLVRWADVVTENFVPGTMAKLGLDYETLKEIKPDIIYASISMQGQYGPAKLSLGYGQLASSLAGIYHFSGWPDRGAAPPQGAYADYIAPRFGAIAILAALDYRRRTGKGTYIEVALTEATIQFIAPAIMDYLANGEARTRKDERHRWSFGAPHGAFPCKGDDRWVAIAVHSDEEWQEFCKIMGNPPWTSKFKTLLERKKNELELENFIGEWTINYGPEELAEMLQAGGVPASPVERNSDLFEDHQLKHRGHFRRFEHTVLGSYSHDSRAFRLSKTADSQFVAPMLGQHNEYVCKEILGLSDEEINELLIDGAITTDANLPKIW